MLITLAYKSHLSRFKMASLNINYLVPAFYYKECFTVVCNFWSHVQHRGLHILSMVYSQRQLSSSVNLHRITACMAPRGSTTSTYESRIALKIF